MTHLQKVRRHFSVFFCLMFLGSAIQAEPVNWEIDSEHFSIAFEADHIGYQSQLGLFLEAAGEFRFDVETLDLLSGRVEVQAGSIFTNNEDRDDHLRGRDFLNSRRHPLVLFEATGFLPNEERSGGELKGDLTLLGATHSITLDIKLNKMAKYPFGHRKETLGLSATAELDRSQWGMDYGVSNDMVGDTIKLRFEFEAFKK